MDLAADEPSAILSKSVSLIKKTINRLVQVDESQFPTLSSKEGRGLLLDALSALLDPPNLVPISPAVLYNRLFSLQELTETICQSSTDRISWPLVSYCDEMWRNLLGTDGPGLFYSLTRAHNYTIFRFSERLRNYLRGLLPQSQIDRLLNGRDLYCLELPSSEDANLPLYANIGHEFGHAVYELHYAEIQPTLRQRISGLLTVIHNDLQELDSLQAPRRFRRMLWVLSKFAAELFCDLVGSLLMGPAFFLSLFEMSWGNDDRHAWTVWLPPDEKSIRAYPSFPFRLDCIRRWAGLDSFCSNAKKDFARLNVTSAQELAAPLETVPVEHAADVVRVRPTAEGDADALSRVLGTHLVELKRGLEGFAENCVALVGKWWPVAQPFGDSAAVAELLHRLEHRILPNIVPEPESLLGKCAAFAAILNASALFRLRLLTKGDARGAEKLAREIGVAERLTAKALEVTFVQIEYSKWSEG